MLYSALVNEVWRDYRYCMLVTLKFLRCLVSDKYWLFVERAGLKSCVKKSLFLRYRAVSYVVINRSFSMRYKKAGLYLKYDLKPAIGW